MRGGALAGPARPRASALPPGRGSRGTINGSEMEALAVVCGCWWGFGGMRTVFVGLTGRNRERRGETRWGRFAVGGLPILSRLWDQMRATLTIG